MLLTLVLPRNRPLISGGNLYNDRLADALAAHVSVRIVDPPGWLTGHMSGHVSGSWALVDSLCLAAVPDYLASCAEPARVLLLAHLLPSHDPAGADPARLALERQVLQAVDGVLATGEYGRAIVRACLVDEARIVTVPPALSWSDDALADVPGRGADGPARALLVGNIIPVKGFLGFLRALDARLDPSDTLAIDIVGPADIDPAYAQACTIFANSSTVLAPRVHFHGPVAHADMPGFYRRASVFVSSSRVETFGMALQEARRVGVPVLARRGGNAAAHVPGPEVGALYDDVDGLADGLLALVRAPIRLAALRKSARAARLLAGYTWADAARSLLDQLQRVPVRAACSRPE